jgi:hypothetical protein
MATDKDLVKAYTQLRYKPYAFVLFNYPWGKKGTALENEEGPDKWQKEVLQRLGRELEDSAKTDQHSVRIAIRSGHGPGKTALISWIKHFVMSTRPSVKGVVTANTKQQLQDKTWAELSKWHNLAVNKHWFNWTATKYSYILEGMEKAANWFIAMTPWSKERSEAFAGTHAAGGQVLVLFDEASAIEKKIWEVTEGAMTDPSALWIACGNPTMATGNFADCFGKDNVKNGGRWITFEVDSRTAKKTNKDEINRMIATYGEDSDFVRVRVLGKPPRAGAMQLIGNDLVVEAAGKVIHESEYADQPKILSVDVARSGDDASVFIVRQGLATYGLEKFSVPDSMQLASLVARRIEDYSPDAVFIDVVGIGAGVVDRLRALGHFVTEVNGAKRAGDDEKYNRKRTEMWCLMKEWLELGGAIPDDTDLKDDLLAPEYGFDLKDRWQLERKVDVKTRLGRSPDCGDALAMTFAEPVVKGNALTKIGMKKQFSKIDYDVLGYGFDDD